MQRKMTNRDLGCCRGHPPRIVWPGAERVAVSFVLNFEEGAQLSIADEDEKNEDIYEAIEEVRDVPDPCMISHFEYGTRAGYWRIMNLLDDFGVKGTIGCCGRAAERSPDLVADAAARSHELSCHGYRWEIHAGMDETHERRVIARTVEAICRASGFSPVGWHTRSAATVNTRRLLARFRRMTVGRAFRPCPSFQTSICSAMAKASSTSKPRYRTMLSTLVRPSSNCTALRFPVRR